MPKQHMVRIPHAWGLGDSFSVALFNALQNYHGGGFIDHCEVSDDFRVGDVYGDISATEIDKHDCSDEDVMVEVGRFLSRAGRALNLVKGLTGKQRERLQERIDILESDVDCIRFGD